MQLISIGHPDIYLTGTPQITFWKSVYRRHTNFAMETVLQSLTGDSTASATNKLCSSIISRNGDLVSNVYITSNTAGIVNGDSIIEDAVIEIGGQRIDNAQLVFSSKVCGGSTSDGLHIYAVNYNVLRVMSGMGGLAYSN